MTVIVTDVPLWRLSQYGPGRHAGKSLSLEYLEQFTIFVIQTNTFDRNSLRVRQAVY